MTREDREAFDRLFEVITERRNNPKAASYTTSLLTGGVDAIGVKVLEEADELVEAAKIKGTGDVVHEAADLVYHTFVLLAKAGVTLDDVRAELARREGTSGLEEKRSRSGSKIQSPKSKIE